MILVVDDDPTVRALLTGALKQAGHAVRSAGSADEALAILAVEPVVVLLTDLHMPGRDGLELFREARHQHPLLRGIACSAFIDYQTVLAIAEAGFDDCLSKQNLDFAQVQEAVDHCLSRQRLWRKRVTALRIDGRTPSGGVPHLNDPARSDALP